MSQGISERNMGVEDMDEIRMEDFLQEDIKQETKKNGTGKKRRKPQRQRTSGGVIAVLILVILMFFVLTSGVGLMYWMYTQNEVSNQKISQFIDDERASQAAELESEEYQEDGFMVAEVYEIKSTKNISDAYLNGDISGLTGNDLETYNMAVDVIKEVTNDSMTAFEKEVAIYQWMTSNLKVGDSSQIHIPNVTGNEAVSTPYGVLKGRKSVCVGFATTFRLFMNMFGLDCHVVHNSYHSWDLVQLDDGNWYHVDIYSDCGVGTFANFNMTDSICTAAGHSWDDKQYLPAATSTNYNYATMNAEKLAAYTEIPSKIKERAEGNSDNFALYYNLGKVQDSDYDSIMYMFSILNGLFTSGQAPEYMSKYVDYSTLLTDKEELVVAVRVTDYNNSGFGDTTAEDASQVIADMTQYVNDAFGTNYDYYAETYNY